jgi:hypothetical protein
MTPMTPMRKAALAAGLFYIATFVFSIPALGLYDGVVNDPNFVLGAGSDQGVLWGGLIEVLTGLACIGTAVALYPFIKRHGAGRALGFVASRTIEAAMIFTGVLAVLAVFTLRQDFAGGADTTALTTTASALVAVKDWTFLLGPGVMPAVNALCLATIMYRSRLVPRWIPDDRPDRRPAPAHLLHGHPVWRLGPGVVRLHPHGPAHRHMGALPRRVHDRQGLQDPSVRQRAHRRARRPGRLGPRLIR